MRTQIASAVLEEFCDARSTGSDARFIAVRGDLEHNKTSRCGDIPNRDLPNFKKRRKRPRHSRMSTAMNISYLSKPVLRAYWVLRIAFTVVPIIAGVDQFTDKLVNWDMYLAPLATRILPLPAHRLMMLAGAAEIIAGLIVAFAPRIGGWIVAIWLWLIIINLLIARGFYDNALRDFGLSLGAVALALLSAEFSHRRATPLRQQGGGRP